MEQIIRILLPAYFVIYFGIAFVAKSLIVARRIGQNPLVLPKDDSAYGLIGYYFKITLILMFIYTVFYALIPAHYEIFLVLQILDVLYLKYIGIGLLVLALIWTIIAQTDMKDSWRIGIDTQTKTELITTGLFKYSRNPIFLGMLTALLGLFLLTPNALTLIFLLVGYILIQIQIRLEEEFLAKEHGDNYLSYMLKVRRFI
ncbi:MAG: isoprenylcysteine carboxylmethyltransferase family protein [Chitinophagales bacterium]|nr:isoprenylcysteine carboxylmethyltransferase family protein [Chitinophagales bacterium]